MAAVSSRRLVKRREVHFLVVAVGSVLVLGIVIETLATWFTADMRDARALGLGRGLENDRRQKQRDDCKPRQYRPL
jgi:hypothetical protein